MSLSLSFILLLVGYLSRLALSKRREPGDLILLYANHVGPHYNPHETYRYYSYPFCRPEDGLQYKFPSIGDALEGQELVEMPLQFSFMEAIELRTVCEQPVSGDDFTKLRKAIEESYWYEYYLDDLPIWGMIGRYDEVEGTTSIYTHQHFTVGYNRENKIVEVSLETRSPTLLKPDEVVPFTYSVEWRFVDLPYSRRFERYLDDSFFEHKIHWFSIVNSFLMVLFLAGVLFMIVIRTVRADKTDSEDDLGAFPDFGSDETVWKKLSSDVFRRPGFLGLFSAIIGSGIQMTLLVFLVIVFAVIGTFYDDRGAMWTTFIVFYVITAAIAGYYSGSYYIQNKGEQWIRTMILTSSLIPGFLVLIYGIMDLFALLYHSSQSIPFFTVLIIFGVHFFLTTPLVFLGTILGRNFNSDANFPCQPKLLKRPIPKRKPWYLNRFLLVLSGGLLPFGSIFIELYFILSSFQTYKIYYVYGFFLAVFCILLIVTVCVSVVLTYVLLVSEDHRWHWMAFFVSASTGIYAFAYSLWFYRNTNMSGIFQFVFYVCHCAQFSFVLGLICGTVGFVASAIFVKQMYKGIRID